jgi:hypothetical protein
MRASHWLLLIMKLQCDCWVIVQTDVKCGNFASCDVGTIGEDDKSGSDTSVRLPTLWMGRDRATDHATCGEFS